MVFTTSIIASRKGQLTLFILLGMVIITVFGFVFFASSQITRNQAQVQADQVFNDIVSATPLRFYVSVCTEKALSSGLDMVAKQGGKIFPWQKGSIMKENEKSYLFKDPVTQKEYYVGYGIFSGDISVPQYPCIAGYDSFDQPPAFCAYSSLNSRFNNLDIGVRDIPTLCKNRYGGCSVSEGWNPDFSVQAELESYVSAYMNDCVNFTQVFGINETYNIEQGVSTVNVTFSDEEVNAVVNLPLIISPRSSQPVIKIYNFQQSVTTRFKQAYGIARELSIHDTRSPAVASFNTTKDFNEIIKDRYGDNDAQFTMEYASNVFDRDSLFRLIDTSSDPSNPLIIQFMRENRPPVIEYNLGPASELSPFTSPCMSYDAAVMEGTFFEFVSHAFDADEDTINFSYSGWLENYNETGSVIPGDPCPAIQSQLRQFASPADSRWNKQQDFLYHGNATTFISHQDIGLHNLTLTVCDSQYCNSRTFRILVDDYPQVSVNSSNPYGNTIFSIEDPYTVTANLKDYFRQGDYHFNWDIIGNSVVPVRENLVTPDLPLPFDPYSFSNIKTIYTGNGFVLGNTYSFKSTVIQRGFAVDNQTTVRLDACVPYSNPNSPSYPYNASDPFTSDHACCYYDGSGIPRVNGTITSTDGNCYAKDTYGSYRSFNPSLYQKTDSQYTPKPTPPVSNDIWKRTFSRTCGGIRGNACLGTMNEQYVSVNSCDSVFPAQNWQSTSASCRGPDEKYLNANSEEPLSTTPQCKSYDANTFESLSGQTASISCTSATRCVTSDNAPDGYEQITGSLRYSCTATCSSQYGCTRTIAPLCHDCYQDQSCASTSPIPTQPVYDSKVNITAQESGCANIVNGGLTTGTCSLTKNSKQSSCSGTVLTTYYCAAKVNNKYDTNLLVKTTPSFDCKNFNEGASMTPANKAVTDKGSCTYHLQGTCSGNKCNDGGTSTLNDAGVTNGTVGYVWRQFITKDTNSNGVQDSCSSKDTDYDSSATLCSSAYWPSGANPSTPHWNATATNPQRKCCGDDSGETWNNAQQKCFP